VCINNGHWTQNGSSVLVLVFWVLSTISLRMKMIFSSDLMVKLFLVMMKVVLFSKFTNLNSINLYIYLLLLKKCVTNQSNINIICKTVQISVRWSRYHYSTPLDMSKNKFRLYWLLYNPYLKIAKKNEAHKTSFYILKRLKLFH
jgi:hypothetical protein